MNYYFMRILRRRKREKRKKGKPDIEVDSKRECAKQILKLLPFLNIIVQTEKETVERVKREKYRKN
jgi:hypothetical protein